MTLVIFVVCIRMGSMFVINASVLETDLVDEAYHSLMMVVWNKSRE